MKSVHLVIPDLFLPKDIAGRVCKDLHLPALEKLLARGVAMQSVYPSTGSGRAEVTLEGVLCELFGVAEPVDAPIAAISAAFDRLGEGCWLRADPVHLYLDNSRMLLAAVSPTGDEATALCAALNDYFAGQGMEFFAPHPQRWYVRVEALPRMRTVPLSRVIGDDVRGLLPSGEDAARWHGVFNEIQMLLFAHAVNESREARGEMPVNSVWLWGGGEAKTVPEKNHDSVSSDDILPEMFAAAAGVPFSGWGRQWRGEQGEGRELLVWTGLRAAMQRGDLAAWRDALQDFETGYAQPLWKALRAGRIGQLQIDILCEEDIRRVRLSRGDVWAFWRRTQPLARYSMV